ncbi:c-type cytochrome [Gimesia panareensis]|uniref:Cytochrome c n=1 Tax=Gimesia panareensis TaxID=2527978 RepID=A0A518A8I1_9PLAN|nr:c-type cytochrome [Gimesia panareensis]QDT28137.1 Cytochrome c [Gimesia panareensis]QDU51004.1 Cytochrome c [Gimesia panareensis]
MESQLNSNSEAFMITPSKASLIRTVIILLVLINPRFFLQAATPEISLQIERLENTWLQEVAEGDYRILVEGEPLKRISGAELPALRDLEIKLQNQKNQDPQAARKLNALLIAMGRIADEPTLIYLHELFESYPERRNDIAEAISWYSQENQRRDADWRILVRSLNIVEGKQAQAVMQALTRFHRRSNKAQWIRQVILVGLQQDAQGQEIAVKLLEHWTGQKQVQPQAEDSSPLVAWQKWFAEKYPDELPAVLPVEPADTRWKYRDLLAELQKRSAEPVNLKLGAQAFVKATCVKCHLFGKTGEKIGPDLTHVSRRFQQKEILQATVFPSHFVSEEYPTFTIVTSAGKTFTGMMGAAGPDEIMLLTSEGKRQLLKKKDVEEIIPVKKSSMPEGLLNLLTKEEAIQLIRYLSKLPEGASERYRHTSR